MSGRGNKTRDKNIKRKWLDSFQVISSEITVFSKSILISLYCVVVWCGVWLLLLVLAMLINVCFELEVLMISCRENKGGHQAISILFLTDWLRPTVFLPINLFCCQFFPAHCLVVDCPVPGKSCQLIKSQFFLPTVCPVRLVIAWYGINCLTTHVNTLSLSGCTPLPHNISPPIN